MSKIIKFGTPCCPMCKMIGEYMKKNNIEFEDVDMSDPANKHYEEEYQIRNIPVVVIDGEIYRTAPDAKKAIDNLLK